MVAKLNKNFNNNNSHNNNKNNNNNNNNLNVEIVTKENTNYYKPSKNINNNAMPGNSSATTALLNDDDANGDDDADNDADVDPDPDANANYDTKEYSKNACNDGTTKIIQINSNNKNNNNYNNNKHNNNNNKTVLINRTIKYDLFPEVKFCTLSNENLNVSQENVPKSIRKNSRITTAISEEMKRPCEVAWLTTNDHIPLNGKKRCLTNQTESTDSIASGVSSEKKKPEMPDGGYGWVVVFASLVVSLIADGLSFSFGLINTELLAYFGESTSKTAWISSLFFSVPLLMGPIWSNLVDTYGCRKMTIIGGVVSAVGFGLSSLCNSIEMLMVTFGIISGLGLGIGYVTAVVSIAFWFDKKRTFATGIGASGTGVGTFLYAPLTQWLIDSYGWRGATLILAGTMLNTCVCGALMRDPDWLIEENRLESRSQSETTFSNSSVCLDEIKKLLDTGATKEYVLDTLVTKNNTEANQQIEDPAESHLKRYRSEIFPPTYLESQELYNIYEMKSMSRRSLRQREGVEAPSRENLLSMSSAGVGTGPTTATICALPDNITKNSICGDIGEIAKRRFLASIETLSPSENYSISSYINQSEIPFNNSLCSMRSSDDGYITQKHKTNHNHRNHKLVNSCYSLNENIFYGDKNQTPSLTNLKINGLRHNSVDIINPEVIQLYHQHSTHVKDKSLPLCESNLKKYNESNFVRKHNKSVKKGPTIIYMPESNMKHIGTNSITGLRRLSKSKKPTTYNRSNLRRNISIKNSNYLKDMRIHRNSIHYRGAMLNTHRYRLRASSCPNIYRNSMTTIAKEEENTWYDNIIETMITVFDLSLFADIKFILFSLSTLSLFIWFIIPYLYLPEYMKSYEYETADSARLISAIGVAQTIGMIGLGYLGDRSWMNVNICYSGCMLFCGLSVALMPLLVTTYSGLLATCILFGFTFASSFSFTPSILVSIVHLDDFTSAYGLVLLVQGIGMIAGPPIAGAIYESTLRWDDAFYYAGLFIALSGVFSYFIEFCKNRKEIDGGVNELKKSHFVH